MRTLVVVATEERTSQVTAEKQGNGGRYMYVTLEGPGQIMGFDELGNSHIMAVPKRKTSITAWIDSPIPGRNEPDYLHDAVVGQRIPGAIIEREVEDYFIVSDNGPQVKDGKRGRFVPTASVPVFGNSDEKEDFDLQIAKTFRTRGFILKGKGNLGAPGGNITAALTRPGTRVEGQDTTNNLPVGLREEAKANPEVEMEYTRESAHANDDESSTAR